VRHTRKVRKGIKTYLEAEEVLIFSNNVVKNVKIWEQKMSQEEKYWLEGWVGGG